MELVCGGLLSTERSPYSFIHILVNTISELKKVAAILLDGEQVEERQRQWQKLPGHFTFTENYLIPSSLWWISSWLSCCKLSRESCWKFCSKVSTGLLLHILLPWLPGQGWTGQQGVEAGEGDAGEGVCLPGLLPLLQQHPAPAAQSLQGKQGEGATADTLGP